jgi:large subunit ribosomal protein L35
LTQAGPLQNARGPAAGVAFSTALCHKPAARRPAEKGCRGGDIAHQHARLEHIRPARRVAAVARRKESQMPKIKTKSGAKKRFKITAGGRVKAAMAGKRHGMIKRTNRQIRQHRGTRVLFKTDGDNVVKYFLPNV